MLASRPPRAAFYVVAALALASADTTSLAQPRPGNTELVTMTVELVEIPRVQVVARAATQSAITYAAPLIGAELSN